MEAEKQMRDCAGKERKIDGEGKKEEKDRFSWRHGRIVSEAETANSESVEEKE